MSVTQITISIDEQLLNRLDILVRSHFSQAVVRPYSPLFKKRLHDLIKRGWPRSVLNLTQWKSRLWRTRGWLWWLPDGLHTQGKIYWAEWDPTLGHEQSGRPPILILSES